MNKILKLSDVCLNIIDCPHESPVWLTEGYARVIRNFNLIDGQISDAESYYVDENTYNKRIRRAVPEPGDIIFSREAPIGNCAIVPEGFKCCLGQRLVLLKVDNNKVSSEYLLAVLMSGYVKYQIEQVSKRGSIVSNFNISDLSNLKIPVLINQSDIAKFAIDISSKITNNLCVNNNLESFAKTIYDYWFLQFEFPNEEGKPYKSSGGKMVWNEELKKEIPEGWGSSTIRKVLKEANKSKVQVGEAQEKGKYPFFTSGENILRLDEYYVDGFNMFLNTGGNPDIKAYKGKCAYSTDTWCINANDYSYILYYYILKMLPNFEQLFFAGSGLKHLQKEQFKKTNIIIPSNEILKKFNDICEKCWSLITKLIIENQQLTELRDFLLPMLMNGQVTFKDEKNI